MNNQSKSFLPVGRGLIMSMMISMVIISAVESFVLLPQRTNKENNNVPSRIALFSSSRDEQVNRYLATCIPGLAPVLAQELEDLGATSIETSGNAAVVFEGTNRIGLKSLIHLRTAHRLLELIADSDQLIESRDDIHNFIRGNINVKQLLGDGKGGLLTISVSVVLNQKGRIPADINHSHYTALSIKNALVDYVRDLRGDRPDVDIDNADVPLVAILRGTTLGGAQISLYRCLHPPGSLHRRGYRGGGVAMHKAAMKESMAAGLLLFAGWKDKCAEARESGTLLTLVDPMGGSGSLAIEAAMMAANVPPGLMRIKCGLPGHQLPPVLRWKDGQDMRDHWKELLQEAAQEAKLGMQWISDAGKINIISNDMHDGALEICAMSLKEAGLANIVELREGDCEQIQMHDKILVVTNPPWGVRLTEDMEQSWESLRTFLRSCPSGTEAWVLSGNKQSTKHLGLKRSQSMVIKTADQDLRWIQYHIHDRNKTPEESEQHIDTTTARKPFPQKTWEPVARQREPLSPPRQSRGEVKFRQNPRKGYQARTAAMLQGPTRGKDEETYTEQRTYTRKGENAPLTDREREERKNSWNI